MKRPSLFLVLLLVTATILIAGCTTQPTTTPTPTATTAPTTPVSPTVSAQEQACISSGGNVTTMSCCGSASDFPNLCLIGACGCSPTSSHPVKACDCGTGKCFDGTACKAV